MISLLIWKRGLPELQFSCLLSLISCDFTAIPGYPALAGLARSVCGIGGDFEFAAVFQLDNDSIACLGYFDFHILPSSKMDKQIQFNKFRASP